MAKLSQVCPDMGDEREFLYGGDIKVWVRPYPNPEFDAFMAKEQLTGGVRRFGGSTDEEEASNQIKEGIAYHVLSRWENMEDEDTGEAVTYSGKKALEYFQDPRYYHFYKTIREEAAMMAQTAQIEMQKSLKNSNSA
jgi:hypothetical protein